VKPTFGSLFAGVGGFDMGMEQAGWECKFQVEWDKHCRSVLDLHWSDVEKWSDVRNVNGRFIPPVDCIIFGSPCQDLSKAGNRAGLSGDRSSLFFEAIRIIKEMRDATGGTFPKWAIWENVAGHPLGILRSNNKQRRRKMQVIPKQKHGSKDWLLARWKDEEGRCVFGASDVPVLMGASPYKTRGELFADKVNEPVSRRKQPCSGVATC
jgi:hypothetical protein